MRLVAMTACAVALTAVNLLSMCSPATAATYLIEPNGSGDYETIQAALDAVTGGDIIELAPGTYDSTGNRDVSFMGKAVTVRGQTGDPDDVVIDCEGSGSDPHRGFLFNTDEGSTSVLKDVTITNAYTTSHGAAIYCQTASPTIDGCVFDSNNADGSESFGGAIYFYGVSTPTITGCSFTGNKASEFASGRGGAIACRNGADVTISNCYFANNIAEYRGGGIFSDQCDVTISSCIVASNKAKGGGGIYVRYGMLELTGCSVSWNNGRGVPGGGGGLRVEGYAITTITGCTFVGNDADIAGGMLLNTPDPVVSRTIVVDSPRGGGVWYTYEPLRDLSISCCNVFNNVGGNYSWQIGDQTGINDNISVDPLFCDAENGDFTLFDTSPCSPDSSECEQIIGAYGVACDSPVEAASWGSIKAIYR